MRVTEIDWQMNLAGLTDASEWCLHHDSLFETGAQEACAVDALSLDHAGIDGVDADVLRQDDGDGADRGLCGGVG